MTRSLLSVLGLSFFLILTALRPSFAYDVSLGGVNLTAYCQGAYGSSFKSLAIGSGAGDWVCQNGSDIHDRRPISVQTACQQQYSPYKSSVKAKSGAGAGSWVCVITYAERPVNLTTYCRGAFGGGFVAKLIGPTSGDWVCEGNNDPHNTRSISVADACKQQYSNALKPLAVPPSSWVCVIKPS